MKLCWVLLTRNDMRTFEELEEQLYMFERSFTKVSDAKVEQEVLVVKLKRHWDDEGKNLTVYLHHQVQLYYISLPGYAVSTTVQNDTAVLVHDNNMKVLVTLVAIVAVFASVESGYIGGGHGGGGGGGGYGGGSPGPAGGLETPIIHTGAVVSHVFGPPPPALGLPGPAIPDHGFERYVFHKPSPPLYVKGHH
ncbi:hypothetical protein GWI33_002088 [Rhynchophorus ferrugineus]|uniref:Uncharacterized protein n=1 Tax=Rhynchophorus ferrugineus TaxID=354439 RepID=A0A834IZT2_RHYFE|nr:hypothetical protein GWI33_002088 [Rhynchophorus ferrugineus]